MGFSGGSVVKNLPAMQEMQVQSLGWKNPLEKEIATHSSIFAWEIRWTEKPEATVYEIAVRHDLVTEQQQYIRTYGYYWIIWKLVANILAFHP